MKRLAVLIYGVVSYAIFFASFCYGFGFVGNLWVPKAIDSPRQGSLALAALVNIALLAVFALQHSVMARPGFKRWWTTVIPEAIERQTYVLLSSLALFLLYWQWRPMGITIWDVQSPAARYALWGLFAAGWAIVLVTTFLINHFDLFGLRQTWLYFRGKPITPLDFRTPGPYKIVRHPLYIGWLTAFWATPTMTLAHLAFAVGTTVYIFVAIYFEEKDLAKEHPEYALYREQVPMLVPVPGQRWRGPSNS